MKVSIAFSSMAEVQHSTINKMQYGFPCRHVDAMRVRDRSLARAGLPHVMGVSYAMVLSKRMRPIMMGERTDSQKSTSHQSIERSPQKCYSDCSLCCYEL